MRVLTTMTLGALLLAAPPLRAEMTEAERAEFRAEVRAYLLENPDILSEMVAALEARQKETTAEMDRQLIAEHAAALFDDGFSFVGGNPEGGVTIVEFLDYQCGYCRRAHPDVMDLLAGDGDIRWIVKELPILGPASDLAARAAIATLIAAGPEVYRVLNDRLMRLDGPVTDASVDAALRGAGVDPAAVRARMDDPEVTRRIEATMTLAQDLAIQGTPSFVFKDRILRGYVPIDAMREILAQVREAG
jgi:protein-disulfide isomerase